MKHTKREPKDWGEERRLLGEEPHYFWVTFDESEGPQLLNEEEVWEAHRKGKKPVQFRAAPLDAGQRAMLRFLAEIRVAEND